MFNLINELWTEHRKAFLPAVGLLGFAVLGLLGHWVVEPDDDLPAVSAAGAAHVETAQPAPEPRVVRRSAGTVKGVSILPVPAETEPLEEGWVMYITGAVRKPGVYRMPAGARLFQLVEAAGGFSGFADSTAVNMAATLADEAHVHIPVREAPERTHALRNEAPRAQSRSRVGAAAVIDVNSASPEELTALKGIGPALAKNIAEYRQTNGPFRSVEELLNVKGIGEKKLEGFREFVTVGR